MMPLHSLWAKSNNRTHGQFECDVTCFVLVFISFDHMLCAVAVPWFDYVFKLLQIKQVDCKMSTKMCIRVNKRHFVIFLDNCIHESRKPRKRK